MSIGAIEGSGGLLFRSLELGIERRFGLWWTFAGQISGLVSVRFIVAAFFF